MMREGEPINPLHRPTGMAVSSDNQFLILASNQGITGYSLKTLDVVASIWIVNDSPAIPLAISSTHDLAFASPDHVTLLFSSAWKDPESKDPPVHQTPTAMLVTNPCSTVVASVSVDGHVKVWQTRPWRTTPHSEARLHDRIVGAAVHPLGTALALLGTSRLILVSLPGMVPTVFPLTSQQTCVTFVGDGKFLVHGGIDGWCLRESAGVAVCRRVPGLAVSCLSPSPSGRWLAAVEMDCMLSLYDLHAAEDTPVQRRNTPHTKSIKFITFSRDESKFVTASLDGTVCVWSTESWTVVWSMTTEHNPITCATLTADGNTVVWGTADGDMYVSTQDPDVIPLCFSVQPSAGICGVVAVHTNDTTTLVVNDRTSRIHLLEVQQLPLDAAAAVANESEGDKVVFTDPYTGTLETLPPKLALELRRRHMQSLSDQCERLKASHTPCEYNKPLPSSIELPSSTGQSIRVASWISDSRFIQAPGLPVLIASIDSTGQLAYRDSYRIVALEHSSSSVFGVQVANKNDSLIVAASRVLVQVALSALGSSLNTSNLEGTPVLVPSSHDEHLLVEGRAVAFTEIGISVKRRDGSLCGLPLNRVFHRYPVGTRVLVPARELEPESSESQAFVRAVVTRVTGTAAVYLRILPSEDQEADLDTTLSSSGSSSRLEYCVLADCLAPDVEPITSELSGINRGVRVLYASGAPKQVFSVGDCVEVILGQGPCPAVLVALCDNMLYCNLGDDHVWVRAETVHPMGTAEHSGQDLKVTEGGMDKVVQSHEFVKMRGKRAAPRDAFRRKLAWEEGEVERAGETGVCVSSPIFEGGAPDISRHNIRVFPRWE
eukprot:c20328_g1_i6.p1 GENE.c20328_g1_i6~~c20328_g1_i6.p1  ORF type:complete len:917 (+),score=168.71 c20328_g1_i6:259-2751(+)